MSSATKRTAKEFRSIGHQRFSRRIIRRPRPDRKLSRVVSGANSARIDLNQCPVLCQLSNRFKCVAYPVGVVGGHDSNASRRSGIGSTQPHGIAAREAFGASGGRDRAPPRPRFRYVARNEPAAPRGLRGVDRRDVSREPSPGGIRRPFAAKETISGDARGRATRQASPPRSPYRPRFAKRGALAHGRDKKAMRRQIRVTP